MNFTLIMYFLFLLVVMIVYWTLSRENQNRFLLLMSYIFYAFWDWRYTGLLIFSNFTAFTFGRLIGRCRNPIQRKKYLFFGVALNVIILICFKYFNFFLNTLNGIFAFLQVEIVQTEVISILLPIGISFYTFQAISYLVDVYSGRFACEHSYIHVALYISYFPQLVAGPIERATHLIPQFEIARVFSLNTFLDGVVLICWGVFKKIIIADRLTYFVDLVYSSNDFSMVYSGEIFVAIVAFTIQIYADFSAYSDIARGSSKLFGLNLMLNFDNPYRSRSFSEFWRRWHISLSTWMRDYIYIPLGGSRGSKVKSIINTFIVFGISGLWHGANWTFVLWGLLHGVYLVIERVLNNIKGHQGTILNKRVIGIFSNLIVIIGVAFGWTLFRSTSIVQWQQLLQGLIKFDGWGNALPYGILCLIFIFVLSSSYRLKIWLSKPSSGFARACSYILVPCGLMVALFFLSPSTAPPFIYFQF